jgi:NUMOD4 motif/HNH endonuclease
MQIEEWKPVPGYEGLYEVSDHGRVRSLPRPYSPGLTYLKPSKRDPYYHSFSLTREAITKKFRAHELVMIAFNPKPTQGKLEIRHLDGDPLNNRLSNLGWGSPSENKEDRKAHGTWGWKLTLNDIHEIYVCRMFGHTLKALALKYGATETTISHIYNGKTWKHAYAEFFNTYDNPN